MIDYFSNFVIVKADELTQLFFSFGTPMKVILYITKSSTFTGSSLAPFPAHKCAKLNDKGNQRNSHFLK